MQGTWRLQLATVTAIFASVQCARVSIFPLFQSQKPKNSCPAGKENAEVAEIQRVAEEYEKQFDTYEIPAGSSWFSGNTPEINADWQAHTMRGQFGKVLTNFADKKMVSKVWENADISQGEPKMWNGRFWSTRLSGFAGWESEFKDAAGLRSVKATSVPILGVNRADFLKGAPFDTAEPLVYGPGHGAASTALRKGRCDEGDNKTTKAWKKLVRAPANVFLTTYTGSERKQVRTGALAYKAEGNKDRIKQAAKSLTEIVKYALAKPHLTRVPRVRFTQLMARYPAIAFHAETTFIDDQISVINELKHAIEKNSQLISYPLDSDNSVSLSADDVVELRYTTNGYGLDKFYLESKSSTLKYNEPALFTYLRWIGEDLSSTVESHQLKVDARAFLREPHKDYCPSIKPVFPLDRSDDLNSPTWLSKEGNLGLGVLAILKKFDNTKTKKITLQCWNRNLAMFIKHLSQEGGTLTDEAKAKLGQLSMALDILYQLVAQHKSIPTADKIACAGPCSPGHRTAELLQIALLDHMLGVVTFSNCKSGLDRTGIYHAVQSAVDQVLLLYPSCQMDLAFVAAHFRRITHSFGSSSRPLRANTEPKCQTRSSALAWDASVGASNADAGWLHLYDILKNAVLKNMLDVGRKVAFSSTGMPGLKYGGYSAEHVAEKCAAHRKKAKDPAASCSDIEAEALLGHGGTANPMVAAFLPHAVSFGTPKQTMPLSAEHEGELYIANKFADAADLTNPKTGAGLLQDASDLRGS